MNVTNVLIHGGRPGPFDGMFALLRVGCLDSVLMGDHFQLPAYDGNPLSQIAKRRAEFLRKRSETSSNNDFFAGICLAVFQGEESYDAIGDLAAAKSLFSAVSGSMPTLRGALYILPPAGREELSDDELLIGFELTLVMPTFADEFMNSLDGLWTRRGLGRDADLAKLLLEVHIGDSADYRQAIEQGASDMRSVLTNVGFLG